MESNYEPPSRSKALDLDKLASIPSFYLVEADWAKGKIGFYWDRTGRLEFYVMELATGKYERITDGELPRAIRAGYVWGRDNKTIYFAKDKDGDENHDIYALNIETKEIKHITKSPTNQDYPLVVTPDNEWLILLTTRHGQLNLLKVRTDGSEEVPLTSHDHAVWNAKLSKDGRYLAYGLNETDSFSNNDIYLYDIQNNTSEELLSLSKESQEFPADWHPDGRRLLFSSNISGVEQAGVMDLETKDIKWMGDGKHDEYPFEFVLGGSKIVALRNQDAAVFPVIYDVETGESRVPDFPQGIAAPGTIALDDKALILFINTPTSPSNMILLDLETNEKRVLLETEIEGVKKEEIVSCKYIKYRSVDGLEIPALLYEPKHLDENKQYPAVVIVHGGPTGQYFRHFDMMAQYFASMGIVTLLPNIRGSTGYGKEFMEMNVRDWGGMDMEDVGAGHAHLSSLSYVASDRIGVFGGSYGGFMSFSCAVKQPDLWAFTAPWIGISNLWTFWEESQPHFKQFIKEMMGAPGDDDDLWKDRSALFHAENVKAPMLIIHGVNDPRCPIGQSRDFKDKLLELGRKEGPDGDFEYNEFGDEGHAAWSDIQGRIRSLKIVADFMERRLQ